MEFSYLDELNEVQREAVVQTEGPVMIVAGPGSGKTRVLTYRIAHLIKAGIADPFNILALTFTNKAAASMRERIEKIAGIEARSLWMGTFHAVFARILRYEADKIGYPSNFTIYDTQDSRNVIKQIVEEQQLNDKLYKANFVHNKISSAKNSLISPHEYLNDPILMNEDASNGRAKLGMVYEMYNRKCFMSGAMDFDDLLVKTYELFDKHPETLYKYQHKFKYVLIDEYQDTNYTQYMIVRRLADAHQNICVVGDDAQSIYSFRGANIQNILNFEKDYPDLKVFKLEQNYRSTKVIVNAANEIIVNNKKQLPKTIWTENNGGDKIKVVKTPSDNEEGRFVADAINEQKMRHHFHNSDFAILYRTNAQSRAFEESLRRLNITYRVYGGISFYQRKEIKDFIAYLKLIVNPKDEEALRRIINYPARGIGQTSMEKLTVMAAEKNIPLWDAMEQVRFADVNMRAQSLIGDFRTMIKSFRVLMETQNAYDISLHVAKSTGILKELHNDKTPEGVSRYENLQELLTGIKEFTDSDVVEAEKTNQDKSLAAYLQDITLLTDADDDKADKDTVSLMTIHSAKGLEFPCVFVVGLEEELFPNAMSLESRDDLEEERRLFYVAITRAKDKLWLCYAATRFRFGNLFYCQPSRFIEEIKEENLHFIGHQSKKDKENFISNNTMEKRTNLIRHTSQPAAHRPAKDFTPDDTSNILSGMEIEHERFGFGKILQVEGGPDNRIALIFFKDLGQKKIMLKFARIRIVQGTVEL